MPPAPRVWRSGIFTTRRRFSRLPPERKSPAISRSLPSAKRRRRPSSLPSSPSCCRRCSSPTPARRPSMQTSRRWWRWPPRQWRNFSGQRSHRLPSWPKRRFRSMAESQPGSWSFGTRSAARRSPSSSDNRIWPSRLRCDCGDQLRLALPQLEQHGGGIILYLEQEGRGLGLANKIRAYQLQEAGLDTVDANTVLGFDDDERDYAVAVRMLQLLGCTRVRLLTNNPAKLDSLSHAGIDVSGRVPLQGPINADNRRYLTAKATRAGHQLDHILGALAEPGEGSRES